MSNYTITSPISGTIIEKDAKQGDALTSGSTLCVIYDLSYLEMVINVDELQIGALSGGSERPAHRRRRARTRPMTAQSPACP